MSLVAFVVLVMPAAILFLQASALVTAHPEAVTDWRDHFWSVRRWFFGSNLFMVLVSPLALAYNSLDAALAYVPVAAGFVLSIVGFSTSQVRVHGVLAVFSLLLVGANLGRLAMES